MSPLKKETFMKKILEISILLLYYLYFLCLKIVKKLRKRQYATKNKKKRSSASGDILIRVKESRWESDNNQSI